MGSNHVPKYRKLKKAILQAKKKRLQILRQKAAERNPDEFNHGMLSSKSKKGRRIAEHENTVLSQETVKLLRTQDAGYLRTMLQKTKVAIEKLKQEFVLQEDEGADILLGSQDSQRRQHTVFVETREQQERYLQMQHNTLQPNEKASSVRGQLDNGDSQLWLSQEHGNSLPNALRTRKAAQREKESLKDDMVLLRQHRKERAARKSKLAALRSREKDLTDAENELEMQRARMSNSVGGTTKTGKSWRIRERKQ